MANKKIQATATLFLDTKDAQNDAKKFVNDLKQKLSEVETAADKMTVFKDMVAYIAQVDRALAALRKNNKDAFNSMFDGLDSNLKQQLEGLFGVNGAQLGQVEVLREKLNTLTLKSSIKEIRTFAKEINALFTSIGVSAPFDNIDEQFSGRTNTGHIQALATSLANFATVWEDLSARVSQGFGGAGGFGSGVFGGLNKEVQEEIDKLEQQINRYKSLIDKFNQTAKMKKSFDNFDGVELDFEVSEQAVDGLIKKYNELNDVLDNSSRDSVEYANALADRARVAMQLVELNNQLIHESPEKKRLTSFIIDESVTEVALEDFEYEFDDCLQNINKTIEITKNKITELKKSATTSFGELTDGSAKAGFNNIGDAADETGEKVDMLGKKLLNVSEYVSALSGQLKEMFAAAGRSANFEYHIAIDGLDIKARHGSEKSVDIATQTETYLDTLFSDSVLYGHSHRGGTSATNISDIESVLSSYRDGVSIPVHFVVGKDAITTIDFTGLNKDMADQLMREIAATNDIKDAPVQNDAINKIVEKFTGNKEALKQWNVEQFDDLAKYIYDISNAASSALTPIEKFQAVLDNMFGKGKVDATKYESLLSGLDKDNAKSIFNQIASIENLQPIKTTDMLTMGQVNAEIDESIAKYKTLREEANLSYADIRNEVDKVIEHYNAGGSATSGLDFFQKYFPEGEWQNVRNLLTDAYDNLISIEEVTNRIAGEFGVDPDTFAQIPNGVQVQQIDNAKVKLEEFLAFADKMQHENLYGSAENNVDIGKYLERLETAKTELEALGAQGLITAEDLEKVNLAFAEATSHLEAETSHYDSYYSGPSYDYYDEYKEQQERAESAEGENTRLQRQLDTMRQLSDIDRQIGLTYDNNIDELDGLIEERKTLLNIAENTNSLSEEDLQTQRAITREYEERSKFIHDGYDAAEKDLQKNLEYLSFENMGELSLEDIDGYINRLNIAYSKLEEAFRNNLMGDADTFYENIEGPYLRAIAELEIEKERFQKENNYPQQKDVVDSNEVAQLEALQQKLLEVRQAVDEKTKAFEEERITVDSVVDAEIISLQSLITQLHEVVTQINLINDGFNNINANAPKVELKSAPTDQSVATENTHYVTDPQGRPVTMYRGIRNSYSGLVSNRYHGGTFSTDNLELAKEYAGELGKVEKVLLSMKNPLEIDGHGAFWNQIEYIGDNSDEASQKLYELNAAIRATKKLLADAENIPVSDQESKNILRGFITEENTKRAKEISYWTKELKKHQEEKAAILADTSNPYGKKNTNELVEIAKAKGYDGVIFKNIIDSATGDVKDLSNVMVTFEQDQIHYIETIASTFESSITELKNHFGGLTKHISASGEEVEASIRKMVELRGKLNAGEISEDEYNAFISGNAIARDYKKLAKKSMAVPDFITGALDGDEFELKHVIQMINDMLDNMRHRVQKVAKAFGKEGMPLDQLLIDNTNVAPITESPAYEENAVDEVEQLNKLQTVLTEVKNAVLAKTKAFVDEGDVVGQVVGKEVSALMKLAETVDSIVPKVNSLSTKMASIGPIDFVTKKDGDVTESGTTTEDKFKTRVDAKKGSMTKYINDLKDVQYVTDDTRDELVGLRDALDTVKTPKDLNDIIAKFEKLQTEIGILKTSFEKTGLNDIQNVERGLLGSFNTLDIDQKRELEPERDAVIKQLETYKNAVLNGQKVELQAIEDTVRALREKIEVYKQANKEANNAGSAQKKNSKFGDTVSRNATAKYNSLIGSANSDQFASSKEVAAIVGEYEKAYKAMITFRNELRNSDGVVSEADEAEFKRLTIECNEYAKALDKLIKSTMKLKGNKANPNDYMLGSDFVDDAQGRKQALTDFVKSVYDIDVAAEDFRKDWNEVVFAVDNGDGTFTQMTAKLTDARNEIVALAGDTNKIQGKFESFIDGVKNRLQSLSQYFIATVGIYDVWNVIKQGINYVREIDSALTELKKVTDATETSYNNFLQTASKTAATLGSTVSDFVDATADFARLGYDLNQASQLAEAASVYKNVGDGIDDVAMASESIISTMKAFGIEANNAMGIIDRFNEVGKFIAQII